VKRFSSRERSVMLGFGVCWEREVYRFAEAIRVVKLGNCWLRQVSWTVLV
jgi:hypothetical protein